MTVLEMLINQRDELTERADSIEDAAELRGVYAELKKNNEMIKAAESEARAVEVPANAELHNGNVVAATRSTVPAAQETEENPLESKEYRKAFMAFVQKNKPIPAEMRSKINAYYNQLRPEQRAGLSISTDGTSAAIPIVLMQEIINTLKVRYGGLYARVKKMAVAAGVNFAVGDLSAEFKWIDESTVSPNQKTDDLAKISFSYHQAELRIARSYLSTLLTLSDFEAKISEVIATAYAKAMDIAIVRGTGKGMPLGIINDARITNVVTMTAEQFNNWQEWHKEVFAKIDPGYADGEFIFAKATVNSYLETMADANNNPVYRIATGLEVNSSDAPYPYGRFFGHDVSITEQTILPAFDNAEAGDVVGIFWQPWEYGMNEPLGFTLERFRDQNTNEIVDKAYFVADGKVLNPKGFILIKKAA